MVQQVTCHVSSTGNGIICHHLLMTHVTTPAEFCFQMASCGLSTTVCLLCIGDARQDGGAVWPLAAKDKETLPRRSSRRKAGSRSMVPEAAGGATAGGSSVHSGSKRSASQAAGAQLNEDTGPATRKRVRRDAEKLQEAAAATAAAAQPSMQPALGFDPQVVTRQSSQELLPDAAIAAHSKLQGAASSASPGAEGPSPPRNRRAAAAQATAVMQAMLQPLRPAAKPAAKGDTKPGKAHATSGRVQTSRPAVTGAAVQPSPPPAAAADESPTAGQGATSTANGAAGMDPAAVGSKPGDSFHVFRLPRVRPKGAMRHSPSTRCATAQPDTYARIIEQPLLRVSQFVEEAVSPLLVHLVQPASGILRRPSSRQLAWSRRSPQTQQVQRRLQAAAQPLAPPQPTWQ